jgi:galactokinase
MGWWTGPMTIPRPRRQALTSSSEPPARLGKPHPMSTERLIAAFEDRFGAMPTVVAVAPGRINLIGEHTDYNLGFVFPAAIDLELYIAARPTDGPSRVLSLERGEGTSFEVKGLTPGSVDGWAGYGAGMAWAIQAEGFEDLPNIEAVVTSNVPIGSGVSSSAALELAFGVVWNHLAGLALTNPELAKLGQKCENLFVGLNCGIMDQMASACGRAGRAMFLDTESLDIDYAPLPEGVDIVLCDTKKPRALTGSAYNERRSQCETAAGICGVKALRYVTTPMLEAKKAEMTETVYRRARHVVTEDERCIDFKEALKRGDLAALGMLMRGSHESLRDDYEVSCKELDAMAAAAWASQGCIGARMTGAGFGGACVALVESASVAAFVEQVSRGYTASTGLQGEYVSCRAVAGARVLQN